MTALDERPTSVADSPCGWSAHYAVGVLESRARETERQERDAFAAGYDVGFEAGRRQAEAEMNEAWAQLSRRVRASAERIRGPIPEPVGQPQHEDTIWFTAAELKALSRDPTQLGRAA